MLAARHFYKTTFITDIYNSSNMDISQIQSEFEKIGENDDEQIIDFVENHFATLIDYNNEDIIITEDISEIFSIYYSTLGLCNRWTDIITYRDQVIDFIKRLEGKRDDYKELFFNVELVYCEALAEQNRDYRKLVSSLNNLNQHYPKDEDIIMKLRNARYLRRNRVYRKITIVSLAFAFSGLVLGLVGDNIIYSVCHNGGFGIFLLTFLIQHVDSYYTERMPSS